MPRSQFRDIAGYKDASDAFQLVTTTRVTVYVAVPYAGSPQTTVASIFSAEAGAGTPGNPFSATTGEINFWAAPGSYDIKIEDTGTPAKFATKIVRWDPISGDKGLIAAMIGDDQVGAAAIAAAAVGASEIADGSVGTTEIADGTIALADLSAAVLSFLLPTGALLPFAGSAAPTGFLMCDGAAVSRTTYATLFALIGTTYGAGNGTTTFNVPDLRGRVPVGADGSAGRLTSNDALGNSSGEERHTLSAAESGLPAHSPAVSVSVDWHGAGNPLFDDTAAVTSYGYNSASPQNVINRAAKPTITATSSVSAAAASTDHQNMQPYQVVNYMIRS